MYGLTRITNYSINDYIKNNKELIKQNKLMSNEIIPKMYIPSNLIYLDGFVNGIKLNIMIDTGAACCIIFKSVVEKCSLENLIDISSSLIVQSANEITQTLGIIWYLEINLNLKNNKSITIPITVNVIDDFKTTQANEIINEQMKNEKKSNSHNIDIILGIGFLKFYKTIIDFSTMTITLNKNIKIKFK